MSRPDNDYAEFGAKDGMEEFGGKLGMIAGVPIGLGLALVAGAAGALVGGKDGAVRAAGETFMTCADGGARLGVNLIKPLAKKLAGAGLKAWFKS